MSDLRPSTSRGYRSNQREESESIEEWNRSTKQNQDEGRHFSSGGAQSLNHLAPAPDSNSLYKNVVSKNHIKNTQRNKALDDIKSDIKLMSHRIYTNHYQTMKIVSWIMNHINIHDKKKIKKSLQGSNIEVNMFTIMTGIIYCCVNIAVGDHPQRRCYPSNCCLSAYRIITECIVVSRKDYSEFMTFITGPRERPVNAGSSRRKEERSQEVSREQRRSASAPRLIDQHNREEVSNEKVPTWIIKIEVSEDEEKALNLPSFPSPSSEGPSTSNCGDYGCPCQCGIKSSIGRYFASEDNLLNKAVSKSHNVYCKCLCLWYRVVKEYNKVSDGIRKMNQENR